MLPFTRLWYAFITSSSRLASSGHARQKSIATHHYYFTLFHYAAASRHRRFSFIHLAMSLPPASSIDNTPPQTVLIYFVPPLYATPRHELRLLENTDDQRMAYFFAIDGMASPQPHGLHTTLRHTHRRHALPPGIRCSSHWRIIPAIIYAIPLVHCPSHVHHALHFHWYCCRRNTSSSTAQVRLYAAAAGAYCRHHEVGHVLLYMSRGIVITAF